MTVADKNGSVITGSGAALHGTPRKRRLPSQAGNTNHPRPGLNEGIQVSYVIQYDGNANCLFSEFEKAPLVPLEVNCLHVW